VRDTHVKAQQTGLSERRIATVTEPVNVTSFDDWYRREYRAVVALVYALSGSRGAAEDLAQDAFIEAHRRWDSIAGYSDPGAWVRKVAMNKARSRFRRRGAEARAYARHLVLTRPLPNEMPEPADHFWAEVRALPRQQAKVVALHYLEDRPVDEIASILEISSGTVKTHLHRGRATLATRLSLEHDEEKT